MSVCRWVGERETRTGEDRQAGQRVSQFMVFKASDQHNEAVRKTSNPDYELTVKHQI